MTGDLVCYACGAFRPHWGPYCQTQDPEPAEEPEPTEEDEEEDQPEEDQALR